MKKLVLKRHVLGDLRSDELVQVAGGTTATLQSCNLLICVRTARTLENTCNICYQSLNECLTDRCVRTLQDSECVCVTH